MNTLSIAIQIIAATIFTAFVFNLARLIISVTFNK